MKHFLIAVLIISAFSCGKYPEPIEYGKDQCAYCKMTIADPKFGAEVITEKGRVFKYDAIECMIRHLKENSGIQNSEILATAYDQPQELKSKDSLFFIISPLIKSPMGADLAAFYNQNNVDSLPAGQFEKYKWDAVFKMIR